VLLPLSVVVGMPVSALTSKTGGGALEATAEIGVALVFRGASSSATFGAFGIGAGWNKAGCSTGVGTGRPREITTLSPTVVSLKSCGAKVRCRRIQPCEAG